MYDKVGCGKRLKKLRESMDKTQQEVAEEIGISIDTIRKLEQGKRLPSVVVIDLFREYYNTTADYIISGITRDNQMESMILAAPHDKREVVERILDDLKALIG